MSEIIGLENLVKVYDTGAVQVRALDGVSLSIEKGEYVAIMGRSGSGKSTLLNILGCLDNPSSGSYRLDGLDVAGMKADEPTGNLDSSASIEIMEVFARLHKSGSTVIVVTHEDNIAEYAHRILTFKDGRLESDVRNANPTPVREGSGLAGRES